MKLGDVEVQLLQQQLTFIVRVWVTANRCGSAKLPIRSYVDINPRDFPSQEKLFHQVGTAAGAMAEQHDEKYRHSKWSLRIGATPDAMLDPAEAYKLARQAFKEELIAWENNRKHRLH